MGVNLLAGCPEGAISASALAEPILAQKSCHSHIAKCVVESCPSVLPIPAEAARLLLGSHLDYAGDGSQVVPYDPSLVSLPDSQESPVDVIDILEPATARSLSLEYILADAEIHQHNFECSS